MIKEHQPNDCKKHTPVFLYVLIFLKASIDFCPHIVEKYFTPWRAQILWKFDLIKESLCPFFMRVRRKFGSLSIEDWWPAISVTVGHFSKQSKQTFQGKYVTLCTSKQNLANTYNAPYLLWHCWKILQLNWTFWQLPCCQCLETLPALITTWKTTLAGNIYVNWISYIALLNCRGPAK